MCQLRGIPTAKAGSSQAVLSCFLEKKKKKKASARPHAAIAEQFEQFLALIAYLKLVYIFLQCSRISRTDKSFISFPLTIS